MYIAMIIAGTLGGLGLGSALQFLYSNISGSSKRQKLFWVAFNIVYYLCVAIVVLLTTEGA